MDTSTAQLIVFGMVALVMGWFALGVVLNLRRGNAVLRWMQAGLPRLGEKTTLRWLGSSAAVLNIQNARAPFRQVELLLVLEPRDVPWLWLLARARGRRDTLIFRGQLLSAPQFEYDVVAPGSWSERETIGRAAGREWQAEALEGLSFRAPAPTRSLSRPLAPRALEAARRMELAVWRLSSRRQNPHLELHLALPGTDQDARQFFEALRALGAEMGRR